jgi:hypothetical protein
MASARELSASARTEACEKVGVESSKTTIAAATDIGDFFANDMGYLL